jgi:hypothetical protein
MHLQPTAEACTGTHRASDIAHTPEPLVHLLLSALTALTPFIILPFRYNKAIYLVLVLIFRALLVLHNSIQMRIDEYNTSAMARSLKKMADSAAIIQKSASLLS